MNDPRFPYEVELAEADRLPAGTVAVRACRDPIFVIGSPRSGTSILAWALAQQDEIGTFCETDFLLSLFGEGGPAEAYRAGRHAGGGWLVEKDVSREEFFAYLGLGVNALLSSRTAKRRWVDQSPSYTLIARQLAELFPGASFLHILRDGREVVNSMINSGFESFWAKDFRTACRQWAHFVRVASTFEVEWPDRCLTVPYAALVATPEDWFARILEFVGAPATEQPAQFFKSHRMNSSYDRASIWTGENRPAYASSVDWQGPRSPWSEWTAEQRAIFLEEAGEVMRQHGFTTEEELVR